MSVFWDDFCCSCLDSFKFNYIFLELGIPNGRSVFEDGANFGLVQHDEGVGVEVFEVPLDDSQCSCSFGGNGVDMCAELQLIVDGDTKVFFRRGLLDWLVVKVVLNVGIGFADVDGYAF